MSGEGDCRREEAVDVGEERGWKTKKKKAVVDCGDGQKKGERGKAIVQ